MHSPYLVALLGFAASARLGFSSPTSKHLSAAEETSIDDVSPPPGTPDFELPMDFDLDAGDIADLDHSFIGSDGYLSTGNTTGINGALPKRHLLGKDRNFEIYRMRYNHKACIGFDCSEIKVDKFYVDSDCHGSLCSASSFVKVDPERHLCDKPFEACGTKYVMKYTGKGGSCVRFKRFAAKGRGNWTRYAHLASGGRNVGECFVWNQVRTVRPCTGGLWGMESAIKCWILR